MILKTLEAEKIHSYRLLRKLLEGNVFNRVCLSVILFDGTFHVTITHDVLEHHTEGPPPNIQSNLFITKHVWLASARMASHWNTFLLPLITVVVGRYRFHRHLSIILFTEGGWVSLVPCPFWGWVCQGVGMSRELGMFKVCPPGQGSIGYSRQAGGTHHTAMLSCYVFVSSRGVGTLYRSCDSESGFETRIADWKCRGSAAFTYSRGLQGLMQNVAPA